MNRLLVAIMFLTGFPLRRSWEVGAADVGRSAAFFPLVGSGIGALQSALLWFGLRLSAHITQTSAHAGALPAPVLAVLITALGVWITRALHLDGVADMADGFGGGRTREDVLRIMRDHSIGSFGAVALILVLAMKITATAALIERGTAVPYLILAPALARGSMVVLGFWLPYARSVEGGLGGSLQHIGRLELMLSSITALCLLFLVGLKQGSACLLVTLVVLAFTGQLCMRRIGGVTGDTLGASSEVCEALILAMGSILSI